ncbi:MAG TPA: hypothetical protein VGC69_17640 [Bordetella sp.]
MPLSARPPLSINGLSTLLRRGACMALAAAGLLADASAQAATPCAPPRHGFNLVQDDRAPLGSAQAEASLKQLRGTGANAVAIVPFFRQPRSDSTDVSRGSDMSDGELARAIRTAHKLGLAAIVKPHVQIPDGDPGDVRMASDDDWAQWFHHYEQALAGLAAVAKDEHAEALVIGTELDQSLDRPEWPDLIARLRRIFHGKLVYAARGAEGAERVPFWNKLDAVGATLYPTLGADNDPDSWRAAMASERDHLLALAKQAKRHLFIAEIGIRSASGAAARPGQRPDENGAPADEALQAKVLATWMAELSDPAIHTVLVWRWNSDPDSGGASDTDYTVQGKSAERALTKQWRSCSRTVAVW